MGFSLLRSAVVVVCEKMVSSLSLRGKVDRLYSRRCRSASPPLPLALVYTVLFPFKGPKTLFSLFVFSLFFPLGMRRA